MSLLLVSGCGSEEEVGKNTSDKSFTPRISEADFPGIHQSGVIRFVRNRWGGFDTLPTQGLPAEAYERLAQRFAQRNGLDYQWVVAESYQDLLDAVVEGRADVAVSNITVTDARRQRVLFTVPVTRVHEWLLGRTGQTVSDLKQLQNPVIGLPEGTAYIETVARHADLANARVKLLESGASPEEVVNRLLSGEFDYTVMDDNTARPLIQEEPELARLYTFPGTLNLAWAVRRNNPILKQMLNDFLVERHVNTERETYRKQDMPAIRESGRLRMLTVNGPASYFLWRGELMGFDYELLNFFAETQSLELEVVVAPDSSRLTDWLQQGRGDVVAASVTVTPERKAMGLAFSRPYLKVQETFVSAPGSTPINALEDLEGRTLVVNPVTHYYQSLKRLQSARSFTLQREALSTEEILTGIGNGRFGNTLADSHLIDIEIAFRDSLEKGMALGDESSLAWVVRPDQPELLAALDGFLEKNYRNLRYNVIRRKYFSNEKRMQQLRADRLSDGKLSPWDSLVQKVAAEQDFDWRLVVAQIYQESQFNPHAHSFAGARGLLQVLPRTAKELGIDPKKLAEPETGIRAGVEYLAWTRDRFPNSLILDDRLWFALAAYNAGVGHVRDARSLARRKGWNANQWFGSVEKAMLLLSKPTYWRKARHGFVRGTEPVRYVREIRRRYQAYIDYLALEKSEPAVASR